MSGMGDEAVVGKLLAEGLFRQLKFHVIEINMAVIEPYNGESPLAFVERADALEASDELISMVLKEHFGFSDDGEIKKITLQSKVFWERFYLDHALELFQRGGTRYSAVRFIQKKNIYAEQRRRLSDEMINELVDSVGEWNR